MSIRARMIILPLSIVLHYCLTKTTDLTFIGCHNVQIQSCLMVMTTSMRVLPWNDGVRACALTRFFPYPLHKCRLTSAFSYFWIWHISVLTSFHVLYADYVRLRLVHLFSFLLRLHAVETFFRTVFFCVHVVSCPVSFYLHSGFDSLSSCLHVGIDFLLV